MEISKRSPKASTLRPSVLPREGGRSGAYLFALLGMGGQLVMLNDLRVLLGRSVAHPDPTEVVRSLTHAEKERAKCCLCSTAREHASYDSTCSSSSQKETKYEVWRPRLSQLYNSTSQLGGERCRVLLGLGKKVCLNKYFIYPYNVTATPSKVKGTSLQRTGVRQTNVLPSSCWTSTGTPLLL